MIRLMTKSSAMVNLKGSESLEGPVAGVINTWLILRMYVGGFEQASGRLACDSDS